MLGQDGPGSLCLSPGPRAWDRQLRWCRRCLLRRGWGLLVARQCQDLGPACLFPRSSVCPERWLCARCHSETEVQR